MTYMVSPLTLVIAGLDSGGGAGITADMLTIHDMGAYGLPCVSALTSQSLKNVYSVKATDKSLFDETLKVIVGDFEKIHACKVGLVSHRDILESTLTFFEDDKKSHPQDGIKVVWDPVLNATAGNLESADLKGSLSRILQVTTLFTPNLPEALTLASWDEERFLREGIKKLGEYFLDKGAKAVLIKGGHLQKAVLAKDTFVSKDSFFELSKEKINGDGAHGGGCALSSAIAATLSLGYSLEDAVILAKTYVYRGILHPAIPFNLYRPPVGHNGFNFEAADFPRLIEHKTSTQKFSFKALAVDEYFKSEAQLENFYFFRNENMFFKNMPNLHSEGVSLVLLDDEANLTKVKAKGIILKRAFLKTRNLEYIKELGLYLGVLVHGAYDLLLALSFNPSFVVLDFRYEHLSYKISVNPDYENDVYKDAKLYTPFLRRDFRWMQSLLTSYNIPLMVLRNSVSDVGPWTFLEGVPCVEV